MLLLCDPQPIQTESPCSTDMLQEIVTTNAVLRECMETGQPPYKMVEAWDQVQLQTATLLNADQPGVQAAAGHAPGKPMR